MKKNVRRRSLVAGAVLLVLAVAYALYLPVGSFSAFGWENLSLLCPLGALTALLSSKLLIPRVLVSLVAVVLLILLFGRAFCSWGCPVSLISRLCPEKRSCERNQAAKEEHRECREGGCPEKQEGRLGRLGIDSRHGILAGCLVAAAVFAVPVFCLVCPVGLTFALIFFTVRLFAYGEATWAIVLILAALVVELLVFRKWCRWICPLGAFMALVSKGNKTFVPTVDERQCLSAQGQSCGACVQVCPESIDVRDPSKGERPLNECTKCRLCADSCPARAIKLPFLPPKREDRED